MWNCSWLSPCLLLYAFIHIYFVARLKLAQRLTVFSFIFLWILRNIARSKHELKIAKFLPYKEENETNKENQSAPFSKSKLALVYIHAIYVYRRCVPWHFGEQAIMWYKMAMHLRNKQSVNGNPNEKKIATELKSIKVWSCSLRCRFGKFAKSKRVSVLLRTLFIRSLKSIYGLVQPVRFKPKWKWMRNHYQNIPLFSPRAIVNKNTHLANVFFKIPIQ